MKSNLFIIAVVFLLVSAVASILFLATNSGRRTIPLTVSSTKVPNTTNSVITSTTSPTMTPNVTDEFKSGSWETFTSTTYSFDYPGNWLPMKVAAAGASNEIVRLGIPGIESTQSIGYATSNVASEKPDNVTSEKNITIGGKQGYKWITKGNGYVNYRYITTGKGSGSFAIDVMADKEDEALEFSLDQLAGSIRFN